MAITTISSNTKKISIDEFVEFIEDNVDVDVDESVISASDMLQSLANNKDLLIDFFNENLLKYDCKDSSIYSQSSTILAAGTKKSFVVRANLWPEASTSNIRTIEEALFSYELAHDHNFSFLTANYFGPGYETEIWENLEPNMESRIDQHVSLKFLERTTLHPNKIMYYRRKKDIHIQHPPKKFSVSLNLLITQDADSSIEQLVFDIKNRRIGNFPTGSISSKRTFAMQVAGEIGNERTAEILLRIGKNHPCVRTRSAALAGAIRIGEARNM